MAPNPIRCSTACEGDQHPTAVIKLAPMGTALLAELMVFRNKNILYSVGERKNYEVLARVI